MNCIPCFSAMYSQTIFAVVKGQIPFLIRGLLYFYKQEKWIKFSWPISRREINTFPKSVFRNFFILNLLCRKEDNCLFPEEWFNSGGGQLSFSECHLFSPFSLRDVKSAISEDYPNQMLNFNIFLPKKTIFPNITLC